MSKPKPSHASEIIVDIDSSGWDTRFALNGILGYDVYAAQTANGNIYIGGDFEAVGNVPANNIAVWDGEKWSALGDGLNGPVQTIFVNEMTNELFAGGLFTHSGNKEMQFLAKWNGQEWEYVGKTASDIKGVGLGAYVNVIIVNSNFLGSEIIVGGSFSHVDNVEGTSYLAKWNGFEWSSIGGGSDRLVTALYNYGGNLYASGFGSFGSVEKMARWDGKKWNKMGESLGPNDAATAFFANNENLYVGGFFTELDGKPIRYLAQYNTLNNQWHKIGYVDGDAEPEYEQLDQHVKTLSMLGQDNILIGGHFSKAGSVQLNHVGYFSFKDSTFHPINNGVDNVVRSFFADFDKLYAFGSFKGVNRGLSQKNSDVSYGVAKCTINYEDLSNSTWQAMEEDAFWGVYETGDKIIEKNGEFYLVGFVSYGGSEPIDHIAKWNGENWEKLADGLDGGWINDLVFIGDDLYVGGYLSVDADDEFICPLVARWNGTAWQPLGYGLAGNVNSQVFALETDGQNLYVGGMELFYAINPDKSIVDVGNIAKWDGSTWSAMGNLDLENMGMVRSLEFHEGKLFAGGYLTSNGTDLLNNLAFWNGQDWEKEGDFNGQVLTLKSAGNKLYVGGEFNDAIRVLDNNIWSTIGNGFVTGDQVWDIEVVNNKILAAGYITSDNMDNQLAHIVYFDGSEWRNLGGGSSWIIKDILPYENKFLIAGYGGILGGKIPYSGFAIWTDHNFEIVLGEKDMPERLESLLIYPNPTNGISKVSIPESLKGENLEFRITDLSGKVVRQGMVDNYEGVFSLELKNHGLYVIKIWNRDNQYIGKIVVE